jgi:1-acyl-sn-glycerol-3-phosphate acyltransferase
MKRVLYGVYSYVEFVLVALLFLPVMALVALVTPRDAGRRIRGRWMRRFGWLTSRLTPLWKFSVEGQPPADIDQRAFVVVSNHLSSSDPFLLCSLPWDMRWVAKEELFHQPLIGWLLKLGGDISLRRGEKDSVLRMLDDCRLTLASGMSVMLFPEGTRSPDGRLQAFKDGAFQLAIESQVPVLPLVVNGTRECRPKGSRWFGEAHAVVRVLEPISTFGMTLADVPQLRDQVRQRIARELAVMGAPAPVEVTHGPMHGLPAV